MASTSPTRQITTELQGGGVKVAPRTNRYRRTRRSELVIWWREIDRVLLGLVLALGAVGAVAVAASSASLASSPERCSRGF